MKCISRYLILLALINSLHAQTRHDPQGSTPYVLRPGDEVEIHFFYDPELNEDAQIRPDGTLSFGLIGDLQLSGKTPSEVSSELQNRYSSVLKKPAVTVQIKNYGSLRVFVGGEVNRPGTLPWINQQTVLDAVLESGGAKHTAADYALLIRRAPDGSASVLRIAVKAARRQVPEAANLRLQSFDIILLPESKIAHVDRWVDQYVRQMIPGTLTGGFSYLFNGFTNAITPSAGQ